DISKNIDTLEVELHDSIDPKVFLPVDLKNKLLKKCDTELKDIELVFDRSGTCTAFLLRKILEKLLFYVFVENNLSSKIKDPKNPNRLLGLGDLLKKVQNENIKGKPI